MGGLRQHIFYGCLHICLLLLILLSVNKKSSAQNNFIKNEYDSSYINSYTEELTARTFSSLSYASLTFRDNKINQNLDFGVDSKYALGIGINYSVIGINLSFSPWRSAISESKYGKTKSFDFRMNLYGRKIIYDLYLLSHTGFYLSNPKSIIDGWTDTDSYPLRPDMKMFSAGIVAQYIFNNKKFSMRATYLQNEWQKKSAGSFIVGGTFFYSKFSGDSSFVPTQIKYSDFLGGFHFNQSSSINLGINGGYSHTFVLKEHYFLALGLSLGPQINYSIVSAEENEPNKNGVTMGLNGLLRSGIGYNSRKFYVGVFVINEFLAHQLSVKDISTYLNIGIVRLNFAYRFGLKKPIKILNPNYWKFLDAKEKVEK